MDLLTGQPASITTGNGYIFTNLSDTNDASLPSHGDSYTGYLNGNTSGDTNFDTVLNTGTYFTSETLTLNGLTTGTTYNVLSFFVDKVNAPGSEYSLVDSNPNSTPASSSGPQQYDFAGATPLGGYVLGTFTADASGTESFNQIIDPTQNFYGYMGVLVEVVPEPSSGVLLGMGALVVMFISRRAIRRI